MESIVINNGHVIVKDRGRLVEDLTRLNTRFRFAYEKPGDRDRHWRDVGEGRRDERAQAGGRSPVRSRVDRRARSLAIRTDRSNLTTTSTTAGRQERLLDIQLDADRLSLPEIGRYFRPLAAIKLEPAVDVRGKGTLDALNMDVNVVSSAGTARGPLVGHLAAVPRASKGGSTCAT